MGKEEDVKNLQGQITANKNRIIELDDQISRLETAKGLVYDSYLAIQGFVNWINTYDATEGWIGQTREDFETLKRDAKELQGDSYIEQVDERYTSIDGKIGSLKSERGSKNGDVIRGEAALLVRSSLPI